MSILDILCNKVVGHPLQFSALATGVVSSSYFLYGNAAAAHFGIMTAITDPHGVDLPVATKVALWNWHYDRGKIYMSGATMTSAISFSIAALFAPSRSIRYLLLSTAAMSFTVAPWTIIKMAPVNNELGIMNKGKSLQASTSDKITPSDELALGYLKRWTKLHKVRVALGLGAWVAGITAVIVSV